MKKQAVLFFILIFVVTTVMSAQVRYTLIPESPRPGEPVTIALNMPATEVILLVGGRELAKAVCFQVPSEETSPEFTASIIAIPSTARSGAATIRINYERGVLLDIPFTIAPRDFLTETIRLQPAQSSLMTDPDPQQAVESNRLWAILTTNGTQVYHWEPFALPIDSTRRTSIYGTRRVYQYANGSTSSPSIHAGVDFGAPLGTPVMSSGAGRVVFAQMRILTGNSIIIEHAPGVYSLYYHLNSINVQAGDMVNTGQNIGQVGSTGLSTGPHLHWEIRVATENADPDAFVIRPLIDRELITSRIFIFSTRYQTHTSLISEI